MIGRICFLTLLLLGSTFAQPATAHAAPVTQADIIRQMAAQTDNLIDALLARDKKHAQQYYSALKDNLDRLHALNAQKRFNERQTRELFTSYSWMRLIAIDMRQKAWTGAAIAANQMTGEIIRFTDFSDLTKRDMAWMDYLGRDVMLLSMEDMQGNLQTIDRRRSELSETWKRVREELIKDFRNKTLVMQGDLLIDNIRKATASHELIKLGSDEHGFVHRIQQASLPGK